MLDWTAVRMSLPNACGVEPVAFSREPTEPLIAKVRIAVPESVNSCGSSSLGNVLSNEKVREPAVRLMR